MLYIENFPYKGFRIKKYIFANVITLVQQKMYRDHLSTVEKKNDRSLSHYPYLN